MGAGSSAALVPRKRPEALRIVGLCVLAAVGYGVLHDQVTARVCVEYFTIGHPDLFGTRSPTLLGLAWGVLATWWVGVLLGVPLALVATVGSTPVRTARSLAPPVAWLLTGMAVLALIAGWFGHRLALDGTVVLTEPFASRVPSDRHVAFIAVLWAHGASYATGFVGGIVLTAHTWRARRSVRST